MVAPKKILPPNGFFTMEWLNEKYPQYAHVGLKAVITERNCGKSTGLYSYSQTKSLKPTGKLLILRNNDVQMRKLIRDFNDRMKGKFVCVGESIYNVVKEELVNKKTGEVTIKYTPNDLVGYFANISNYANFKSLEAGNINLIFYEEFNERDNGILKNGTYQPRQDNIDMYFKFINVVKTFSRFNDVEIIMVGNRDGFKNDFYVNWDIVPSKGATDDVITEIRDDETNELIGVWYDLHPSNFEALGNKNTLADKLARKDVRTGKYASGEYADEVDDMVINYKKLVPRFTPLWILTMYGRNYTMGYIDDIKSGYYAIMSPWNFNNENLKLNAYALDKISKVNRDTKIIEESDLRIIIDAIMRKVKEQKIYFDSYETLEIIKTLTIKWITEEV